MNSLATLDHPALTLLPEVPTREQIEAFGQFLQGLEADCAPPDLHTSHHVNEDLYGRGVVLQPEAFLVGLAHKRPGFAFCVGDITVWTEQGRQRYTGAHMLKTEPGRMRIGFAHAETTWFTVHRNDTGSDNVQAIEDALVEHADRLMTRRAQGVLQ